jgi:hypothetical protein
MNTALKNLEDLATAYNQISPNKSPDNSPKFWEQTYNIANNAGISIDEVIEIMLAYFNGTNENISLYALRNSVMDTLQLLTSLKIDSEKIEIAQIMRAYLGNSYCENVLALKEATVNTLTKIIQYKVDSNATVLLINAYANASNCNETINQLNEATCGTLDYMQKKEKILEEITEKINAISEDKNKKFQDIDEKVRMKIAQNSFWPCYKFKIKQYAAKQALNPARKISVNSVYQKLLQSNSDFYE